MKLIDLIISKLQCFTLFSFFIMSEVCCLYISLLYNTKQMSKLDFIIIRVTEAEKKLLKEKAQAERRTLTECIKIATEKYFHIKL